MISYSCRLNSWKRPVMSPALLLTHRHCDGCGGEPTISCHEVGILFVAVKSQRKPIR